MAKKFTELRAHLKPDAQLRSEAKAKQLLTEMPLHKLRQARCLSHELLAKVLNVQPPSIVQLEKRTEMYLSTLRSHIEAMGGGGGGELDIIARFPEGTVKIRNFSDLENNS